MALQGQTARIDRVENGFVFTVYFGGAGVAMVAKGVDELVGLIRGVEWTTDRPLFGAGSDSVAAEQRAVPATGGGLYR